MNMNQARMIMILNKNYQLYKFMKELEYLKILLSQQFLLQIEINLLIIIFKFKQIKISQKNQHLLKIKKH